MLPSDRGHYDIPDGRLPETLRFLTPKFSASSVAFATMRSGSKRNLLQEMPLKSARNEEDIIDPQGSTS